MVRHNVQVCRQYTPAPLDMAPAVCYIVVDFAFPFQLGPWYDVRTMCVADREIGLSQGLNGHSTRLVQSLSSNVTGYFDYFGMCHYLLSASGQAGQRVPLLRSCPLLRLSGSQPKSNRPTALVSTPLSKMKRPAAIAAVFTICSVCSIPVR